MRKTVIGCFLVLSAAFLFAQALDGVIEEGEYSYHSSFEDGAFSVFWLPEGDAVHFGIQAETAGWLSLGFDPAEAMDSADMIIGWVDKDGRVTVLDCFSTGPFGPHPPDLDLGGSDDLLGFAGTEREGITTLEFSRKRVTGDRFDKEIAGDGGVKIIWALGSEDDFEAYHERVGFGTLDIISGGGEDRSVLPLIRVHAVLMSLSFLAMFIGMLIARYLKKKRWWLNIHRLLGGSGSVLGAAGLALAVYMVEVSSGAHLKVLHSILGVVTIVLILLTPVIGQTFLKIRKGKKVIRKVHHWFGRGGLLLMLLTIILGLFQAGIF